MRITIALIIASILSFIEVQAPKVAETNAPSRTTITSKDEPGEKLVVSGIVLAPDGKTPVKGASVYVYHTDAKGVYTPGNNDNRNPRLRGYMRTDAAGKYEYTTIKPAPYPGNQVPAHIHYVVTAPGYQERVFEILFEGDPLINAKTRDDAQKPYSGFSIRPATKDQQSVWRITQDVVMQK